MPIGPEHKTAQAVARRAAPRGVAGAALAACLLLVAACSGPALRDDFDPDADLQRQDYRDALAAKPPPEAVEPSPPIPELAPVISEPALGPLAEARRVTVTVTEDTPLKDLLIELARQARVDLELDPRIEGGIIFSAYERPFDQVIRRIANLAGLRYRTEDGVLRIEIDEPYHTNYRVDYLSLVRRATSDIATSSTVVGEDEDKSDGNGGGGASSSSVSAQSEIDFWAELEANITQILTNTGRAAGLVAMPTAQPAAAAPGTAPGAAVPPTAPTSPTAIQRLTPAFTEASSAFTINKQAGILSVYGTDRQHREVAAYLQRLRASVASQVVIEAKVLEVRLEENFRFGINWETLFDSRTNIAANFEFTPLTSAPLDAFTVTAGGADLSVIADLIEQFGTVRALSSPRITVMQNQTGVLKVAEERVFFRLDVEPAVVAEGVATEAAFTSEINTVTVGLVMTVQPSIDLESDQITLTLRPTITQIVGVESDPAVQIEAQRAGADDVISEIPEIAVQEMDSVVTIRSGQILIMGGLMQDNIDINESGIPVLSSIPWLGHLFEARQESISKSELVVVLRATIVPGGSLIDPTDVDLFRRFGNDRRPFPM